MIPDEYKFIMSKQGTINYREFSTVVVTIAYAQRLKGWPVLKAEKKKMNFNIHGPNAELRLGPYRVRLYQFFRSTKSCQCKNRN